MSDEAASLSKHPFGSVEFILDILEESRHSSPQEVCERYSIKMPAFESWHRMYAHLSAEELERLKIRARESGKKIPRGGALAVDTSSTPAMPNPGWGDDQESLTDDVEAEQEEDDDGG